MDKFYHSVRLDADRCKGCINCIKRCPTQAIRVQAGKASINSKFCIDCGECIRVCPHHAKYAICDSLTELSAYRYTVALPAPSLYSQFNNLDDVNIVLNGLLRMGFDDVFEVGAGAELVSEATRSYLAGHEEALPVISTACPSVVRLIRVRFPNLIPHLLPLNPPVEVAAKLAVRRAMERTGLSREEIGIVFLSPCPSKATYARAPLGVKKSEIDRVLSIKDIYPQLLTAMKGVDRANCPQIGTAGRIGISWGHSGGEAGGLLTESYLAADGIENVIRVLEDMEDQKFGKLRFVELNACSGGCVGGVLTVENPYVAKVKLQRLRRYLPVAVSHLDDVKDAGEADLENVIPWSEQVQYEPVLNLGNTLMESFSRLNEAERLVKLFPGLDCGSCGAPTCRALAEDIARGEAKETDCVHYLRENFHEFLKMQEEDGAEGGEKMRVCDFAEKGIFSVVNLAGEASQEITTPYCCDFLSVAMSRAPAGCAWVTVTANLNTLAVAALTEAACVILAEGAQLDENAIEKAKEQEITVFATDLPVFEAALAVKEFLK